MGRRGQIGVCFPGLKMAGKSERIHCGIERVKRPVIHGETAEQESFSARWRALLSDKTGYIIKEEPENIFLS